MQTVLSPMPAVERTRAQVAAMCGTDDDETFLPQLVDNACELLGRLALLQAAHELGLKKHVGLGLGCAEAPAIPVDVDAAGISIHTRAEDVLCLEAGRVDEAARDLANDALEGEGDTGPPQALDELVKGVGGRAVASEARREAPERGEGDLELVGRVAVRRREKGALLEVLEVGAGQVGLVKGAAGVDGNEAPVHTNAPAVDDVLANVQGRALLVELFGRLVPLAIKQALKGGVEEAATVTSRPGLPVLAG